MNVTVTVVRRPDGGRKGRNGAEVKIAGPATVPVPSNQPSWHNAFPPSGDYSFAFWWVQGSALGNFVSTANPVSIPPGPADMNVKCWFSRTNPSPPSGTALFVDAFDLDKGQFLDDDFATVKDGAQQIDTALSQTANTDGIVSTAALEYVTPASSVSFRPFDEWLNVRGQSQIVNGVVTAAQNINAESIAIYEASKLPSFLNLHDRFVAGTWVSWGVTVDAGGPTGGGPVPPWDPLMPGVAAGLALAQAAEKLHPSLRAEVLRLAARQVATASKSIGEAIDAAADAAAKGKK